MDFKQRKISKKRPEPKIQKEKTPKQPKQKTPKIKTEKQKKWQRRGINLALILIILLTLGVASAKILKHPTVAKTILKTIGSELKKDENGFTNILALGVGGAGHEGEELTDTILIGSINEKTNQVYMVSIPRDLYVQHENIISQRINSVFQNVMYSQDEATAFKTIEDIAEEITGLEIHYYAKIDFQGVIDMVDSVGGVTVDVDETIYDPYYPTNNFGYQTFSLGKGPQFLDGETALKYVRSRKTTSDFDRSQRQQKLIFAVKEKAKALNILTDADQITSLFNDVKNNLETDLTIREIISLAAVGVDINQSDMQRLVIHDDPSIKGGFLYTPPRSLYNDAFVLLPAGNNFDLIHEYIKLHQDFPNVMKNAEEILVLNGTRTTGFAGQTTLVLERFGFDVGEVGNAPTKDVVISTIQTNTGQETDLAKALSELTKATFASTPTQTKNPEDINYSATITLGEDFFSRFTELEVFSALIPIINQAEAERIQAQNPEQEETNQE